MPHNVAPSFRRQIGDTPGCSTGALHTPAAVSIPESRPIAVHGLIFVYAGSRAHIAVRRRTN
jgi:hypothetical protein